MTLDVEDTMGRGEDKAPRRLATIDGVFPVPAKQLAQMPYDSSLIAVVEMSQSSWLVAGIVPGISRQPAKKLKPDGPARAAIHYAPAVNLDHAKRPSQA
jgi:hypothetical protein